MKRVPVTVWHGCYSKQWSGVLIPDAFKHPAKYSRALVERILEYGEAKGYWRPGDRLGDVFGGVATGAVIAADKGYEWFGVELEKQFVEIGNRNIESHRAKWKRMGRPVPVLVQGDSRKFAETVAGIVTSPPFHAPSKNGGGINREGYSGAKGGPLGRQYLDGGITSPPYDTISAGAGGLNTKPAKKEGQQSGRKHAGSQDTLRGQQDGIDWEKAKREKSGGGEHQKRGKSLHADYAERNGANIGNLGGVVTSPPWERNRATGHVGADKWKDPKKAAKAMSASKKGHSASPEARQAQFERDKGKSYGQSEGQIGREAGETYWIACRKVYSSMFQALRPGGYAALVVKDYCRDRKRVTLCDDTLRLLEFVGFEPIERIRAMLVEETTEHDLFEGEVTKKTERKSFFRRLYESREGAPKIDWEEVLFVRKPL